MSKYRCMVQLSTDGYKFVPYAGLSFEQASMAMDQYHSLGSAWVERSGDGGQTWETVMGVWNHGHTGVSRDVGAAGARGGMGDGRGRQTGRQEG